MGVSDIEEHEFVDPTSGRTMTVVFGPEPLAPYDGKHGVRHDGCDRLADVSPELDCWYCTDCRGRRASVRGVVHGHVDDPRTRQRGGHERRQV